MIGYYTNNNVSNGVMKAFSRAGIPVKHINKFNPDISGIFYGILRGSGVAMRILDKKNIPFWYVDNGYFDAEYRDAKSGIKDMGGKYRIVKNDMIEQFTGQPSRSNKVRKMEVLMLPPTPYSAFMHDTTPEDWIIDWTRNLSAVGHKIVRRDKSDKTPLEDQLKDFDAVIAFNSMAVMKAAEMGKAIYTTHGIVRNADKFRSAVEYYDINELRDFYQGKQYTLEEIAEGGFECLK